MSKMSDLDLMVREGERTAVDFIRRGYDARTARAMAAVVKASNLEPEEPAIGALLEVHEAVTDLRDLDGTDGDDLAKEIAAARNARDSAWGHGPGCFGECDGHYDCLPE